MNAKPSPCKGKSFKKQAINKAFALTGRLVDCYYTQGGALGLELLGFQPVSTILFAFFLFRYLLIPSCSFLLLSFCFLDVAVSVSIEKFLEIFYLLA